MNIEIEKLLINSIDNDLNIYIEIERLVDECLSIDENFHLVDIIKFYEDRYFKTHYIRAGYLKDDKEKKYYINILDRKRKGSNYIIFADAKIEKILSDINSRKLIKDSETKPEPEPESKKKKNVLTDIELVKIALHMMKNDVKPGKVCDIIVTENNIEHITKIKDLISKWMAEEMKLSVANNLLHSELPKQVETPTTPEPPAIPTVEEPPKKKLSLFRRFINALKGNRNVV